MGDERWRSLRDRHDTLVRDLLRTCAGREVKHTGDGFPAVLPSPSDAVRCAQAIHQQLISHDLRVRAAVHLGECDALGDDLGGRAVHIAARTAAIAGRGEVLVTTAVRDAMLGSTITYTTRGAYDLKGVPGSCTQPAGTSPGWLLRSQHPVCLPDADQTIATGWPSDVTKSSLDG